VKSAPQAGSVAPRGAGRPSTLPQPPQQGTDSTLGPHSEGQDEAPVSRAQQLALIEKELKEIRQGLVSSISTSLQSRAGSSEVHRATTSDWTYGGQTSSTGSKLLGSTSYSSGGSNAKAVLADHIPGLVLLDTLG
jgi:hypothetical protein